MQFSRGDEVGAVLTDSIAERLRASIIRQEDPPGSAITEAVVAMRFGVARPTARLAIDRLVVDGILRRLPHQAARVPQLGRDDIVDLFDNRAVLEATAVAALARTAVVPAPAIIAHRAFATEPQHFATYDIAFHRALVAGQPSRRLAHLHGLLMGEIELCIGQVQAASLLTADQVATEHQAILDAIVASDPDAAARLVRDHIAGARDVLLAHADTISG